MFFLILGFYQVSCKKVSRHRERKEAFKLPRTIRQKEQKILYVE